MFIEAVTVCINYGDFLSEIAPYNISLLDRWIIVTTPQDEVTRDICRKHNIECLTSTEHLRDNAKFSKGRLIDRGFSMLGGSDWMLQLDSDIVLPTDFRTLLNEAHLDENNIYGCDRLNVVGYETWKKLKTKGLQCRSDPWKLDLNRSYCTLGSRVINQELGYTPIGFFQLWHGSSSLYKNFHSKRYPMKHGTAARTDVQHALQWDRRNRVLIPELLVWHLESEKAQMGVNWKGRKTLPFKPIEELVENSLIKKLYCQRCKHCKKCKHIKIHKHCKCHCYCHCLPYK